MIASVTVQFSCKTIFMKTISQATLLRKFLRFSAIPVVMNLNVIGAEFEVYQRGYLEPEEAMKSIELQQGYSLELVLSDPDIKEPVAMAWDGNGALYVVEMRTYMQDADAKGEGDPVSRISRHEDTNGDGVYDKHSVFIDNLLLPRFVLPLDDRVIVGVTNTLDLWTYRDADGDGVADEKVKIYEGGPRGGNMEHQPSGLLWNIDNWMYCTYEPRRYRFTDGKIEVEDLPRGAGQWGIGRDDVGRLYYSTAGGERPALSFQQPIIYGALDLPSKLQESKDFRAVHPIAAVPDVQGGARRVSKMGGLNQFTGGGGQSIYRGDRLPEDLRGDLILPEPVGRLIRRAEVTREDGRTILSNYYRDDEFLRSKDVNFRPLWSATSPDGGMMFIDIHRGIIQQGNWTRPGSYLRGVIDKWGLDKNIGKGRIYRLVHKDYRADKMPQMMKLSTAELVAYLSHPNGWWRDTAQKLIILRKDRESVVSDLKNLVVTGRSPLGRLHALWTLEGIGAVEVSLLNSAMSDKTSAVRCAAIRVAEPFLAKNDRQLALALFKNPHLKRDIEMQLQALNSIAYSATTVPELVTFSERLKKAKRNHPVVSGLSELHESVAETRRRGEELKKVSLAFGESMERGQIIYEQLCFSCHGADGKGAPMPGAPGQFLAPSFANNPRIVGADTMAVRTLLHGLTGDLDGREYEGLMVGMGTNSDEWVADVVTYIRNSFENKAPATDVRTVAALRKEHEGRTEPWTQEELESFQPALLPRRGWKVTASHNQKEAERAIDGDEKTRYTTGKTQKKGMWFEVELPKTALVKGVALDCRKSARDYPRGYEVTLSQDGKNWSSPVAGGVGAKGEIEAWFLPTKAKFVRVTLDRDGDSKLYWTIHEIELLGEMN